VKLMRQLRKIMTMALLLAALIIIYVSLFKLDARVRAETVASHDAWSWGTLTGSATGLVLLALRASRMRIGRWVQGSFARRFLFGAATVILVAIGLAIINLLPGGSLLLYQTVAAALLINFYEALPTAVPLGLAAAIAAFNWELIYGTHSQAEREP
jgi:hypothetical protein